MPPDLPVLRERQRGGGFYDEHEAVARHVEHRAVVAKGDFRQQREVFVQEGHDLVGLEPLGNAGKATQVGE